MTDRAEKIEVGRVAKYIRYLADHLRLRDWQFAVEVNPDLIESLAMIDITPNRRLAVIYVGTLFFQSSPEDQRHGIVHELVHCHHQPIRACVDTLPDNAAMKLLRRNHDNHLESATDDLAIPLAMGLPTMEQFEKRKGRTKQCDAPDAH